MIIWLGGTGRRGHNKGIGMQGKRIIGLAYGVIAALLWGISGPASELVFAHHVSVTWLISSKMVIAGVITLLLAFAIDKKQVFAPWQNARSALALIVFILFGMIAMQYIYYKAVAVSNAPTATILQFLSPVVVLVYVALKSRQLPRRVDVVIVLCALFGTLMVVTKGHLTQLAISPNALMWGLLSAVAAASYAILPAQLLETYSPLTITAWAQLLGGIVMSFVCPFWTQIPQMPMATWGAYAFVVVFGTVVAYLLYLMAMQYISVTAVSLLDAFEPLGATVTAVLLMGFSLSGAEIIGGLIIIATVIAMSFTEPKAP